MLTAATLVLTEWCSGFTGWNWYGRTSQGFAGDGDGCEMREKEAASCRASVSLVSVVGIGNPNFLIPGMRQREN